MNKYDEIFKKIEQTACACVTQTLKQDTHTHNLYLGRTKTTLAISVARQLAFLFMHDHYAISYHQIAQHANFTTNAVMKCVRKAREYRFSDPLYKDIYQKINNTL